MKERGERRVERREKKEREGISFTTWTLHQHLIVILILFDNFNGIGHDKC